MFEKARIKLTFWYVVIIMLVSLSFSAFIYKSVSTELKRRFDIIEERLELGRYGLHPPVGQVRYFIEDLTLAQNRVLFLLAYTNGVIFIFSTLAGYFLAGKTLAPIEKTHEEQKRFVADASHELRTPLTSLRTEIEVALRDKKLNLRETKNVLRSNLDEVGKMQEFSDYLLSLSRYESNGSSITKEKVNLKEIVEKGIEINEILARNKNIKITTDLKNKNIKGNKQSLIELISILVNNAVKYSSNGKKIKIKTTIKRRRLFVSVLDQGVGISKEDLPHIFDRFYRADASRSKTGADGYGLGLSIAHKIVELHNGTITVKSVPNKGSVFTVILPEF
jgi:signal transduction histidine kinase